MKQVKFVDTEDNQMELYATESKKIIVKLYNPHSNDSLIYEVAKHEVEEIIYELIRIKKQL